MESLIVKSSGVQVQSVRYMEDKNLIELDYGGEKAKGCMSRNHSRRENFVKLFVIPCSYTLQIPYFKDIFREKPMGNQAPSQHKNYYRTHCHKLCESCVGEFFSDPVTCRKCVVPFNFEAKNFCRREMNLCICGVVPITSLEEFHIVVQKSSEFIRKKKK